VNLKAASEANESLKTSLDAEIKQRQQVEQALVQRVETQKELEAKAAAVLKQRNNALYALRKANEKIDEYRSLSIPDDYFDFVRRQAIGKNGDDPNVSTGKPDSSGK
jgi:hypothetical protein